MVHQLEFDKQDRYDLTMHPYTLVLVTSLTHKHTQLKRSSSTTGS